MTLPAMVVDATKLRQVEETFKKDGTTMIRKVRQFHELSALLCCLRLMNQYNKSDMEFERETMTVKSIGLSKGAKFSG
jgi:hypothetical protein